ncbi:MAG TPA: UDP-glucose 4-epimerase GalE [Nevskia sp.]|nr:UDP-glucose 4-epimerase GalE [Nevskia sp.]
MRILVVGGAGYIGSHMCKMLASHGHEVVVCDNLSTGHRAAVRWGNLIECSLSDVGVLAALFSKCKFDAVMHFAANSLVGESVRDPLRYYRNNVAETIGLLEIMRKHEINKFVFSSTAAVYGQPNAELIDELHPQEPINPYGRTKLIVERILADLAVAHQLRAVSLRYFNAAGADQSGMIGEAHEPETHLIPRILRMAAGEQINVGVFGTDYPTPDGTCIRDYVYVNDLCTAHLQALNFLDQNPGFHAFNLGNGRGHSVRQVIDAVEQVVGRKICIPEFDRRPGDPVILVAHSEKARHLLKWKPTLPDIHSIVESAWKWHLQPKF